MQRQDAIWQRQHWTELAKFSLVGGSGFIVNLVVYGLAYRLLGLHYLAAGTVAFIVASGNNYLLNRRWTFPGGGNSMAGEYVRFVAIGVVALAGNLALLRVLIERFRLPALIGQAMAIVCVTPTTFLGNKLWTFRKRA